MRILLALALILPAIYGYNYLIISPVFGYSHMKFMGKVADILADAGHNVTFLQPILYDFYAHKKVVKNPRIEVVNFELDAEGKSAATDPSSFKFFWEARRSGNPVTGAKTSAQKLYNEFEHICRHMMTDKDLHQWIRSKNFDSHISEAFDFCGLFLGDYLKLKAPIPLYTGVRSAPASHAVGEPIPLNYLPTENSQYGPDSTILDRLNDMIGLTAYHFHFSLLFDKQYEQAYRLTGGQVRTWQEILQSSTFFLTNSNPYLSFSTPTISKVVQVGGCTIDPPKSTKLDEEFDRTLSLRKATVLVSFGTVIQSSDMPKSFKEGLIDTFNRMPETTFIWKYEEDDEELKARLPKNVVLSKWVPQPALLADSRLKIFVTHGGLGSTMEVAYAGIPSVMIPIFSDQGVNAKMLARHGSAMVYSKFDLPDGEKLAKTLHTILSNDDFNVNAKRLSDILHHQPMEPKKVLLNHCEFAARFGEVKSLEPS
uniref:glucuronosyltransferase n=1 Tax=Caenorhabditis japonica TaxID=281687 RepID=A0A8R1DQB0_CAEJA